MTYILSDENIKIKYLGLSHPIDVETDLILLIIQRITGKKINLVNSIRDADLVIAYPYVVNCLTFRIKWVVNFIFRRFPFGQFKNNLRWMLGVKRKKVLFISHENLDRAYWWNMIGRFLVVSDIPRLTYWPIFVDARGERFPYWYNYVNWPEYPRKNFYNRFGSLYDIEVLMSPLVERVDRIDEAVAVISHFDHPRSSLLVAARNIMKVVCFGGGGASFAVPKIELLKKYKYNFCPENSTGYGYDTEKLPEAWISGCIPLGYTINPFSDFNPKVVAGNTYQHDIDFSSPLLLKKPSLTPIENYIRGIFEFS